MATEMASDTTASPPGVPEPPAAPPAQPGIAAFLRWARTGTGIVSTVVSLSVGILTLLFLIQPALRPGDDSPVLGAEIAAPIVETGVALGDYFERIDTLPDDAMKQNLSLAGVVVSFDLVVYGHKDSAVTLRSTVLDADTLNPVEAEWLVDQPGWPNGVFIAEAAEDRVNAEIWIAQPDEPGAYVVRLNLFNADGVRLDSQDSAPFELS